MSLTEVIPKFCDKKVPERKELREASTGRQAQKTPVQLLPVQERQRWFLYPWTQRPVKNQSTAGEKHLDTAQGFFWDVYGSKHRKKRDKGMNRVTRLLVRVSGCASRSTSTVCPVFLPNCVSISLAEVSIFRGHLSVCRV